MFDQDEQYPNEFPDRAENHDVQEYLAARLKDLKARIQLAEEALEMGIRADCIEMLVDANGAFTYRLTHKGRANYTKNTGLIASTSDISFHEMY
jgi:hypothetical protein